MKCSWCWRDRSRYGSVSHRGHTPSWYRQRRCMTGTDLRGHMCLTSGKFQGGRRRMPRWKDQCKRHSLHCMVRNVQWSHLGTCGLDTCRHSHSHQAVSETSTRLHRTDTWYQSACTSRRMRCTWQSRCSWCNAADMPHKSLGWIQSSQRHMTGSRWRKCHRSYTATRTADTCCSHSA